MYTFIFKKTLQKSLLRNGQGAYLISTSVSAFCSPVKAAYTQNPGRGRKVDTMLGVS